MSTRSPSSERKRNKHLAIGTEYAPQHVCELCHIIYKLYTNKRAMLLSCNPGLSATLSALAQKPVDSWSYADAKLIVEAYGHTLPTIQCLSDPYRQLPEKLKSRIYYYGYQSIADTRGLRGESGSGSSRKQSGINVSKEERMGKDFVKLNIRSSSERRLKKSNVHTDSCRRAAIRVREFRRPESIRTGRCVHSLQVS